MIYSAALITLFAWGMGTYIDFTYCIFSIVGTVVMYWSNIGTGQQGIILNQFCTIYTAVVWLSWFIHSDITFVNIGNWVSFLFTGVI